MIINCRKKPIVIQAEAWDGTDQSSFKELDILTILKNDGMHFGIQTLEGMHELSEGCYILRGVDGEFYPCKGEIFEKTYDNVDIDDQFCKIDIITPDQPSPLLQAIERVIKLPFGYEIAIRRRVKTKHEWVQPFQMRVR